ncbi:hypothetical protein AURDEDRAFT_141036 [Auricularia subglabra TFB-10046 SS5]|nr:hypothetical protein AURDEDRAFT_141036 [Auricularia subglabra TFB-10046 SS5]
MDIDDDSNQWERDSLFDEDEEGEEPQISTSTAPPPDSPLTPMSALSNAVTATKVIDPRSKLGAAAADPLSAGPSKPLRPTISTSLTGPGAKKVTGETSATRKATGEMSAVPKVPAHRQKRRLEPLPFDQVIEMNAAGNSTKARIIGRVNGGVQRPELSINTSSSQDAAAPSPSPVMLTSRNVSLEPSSAKPGPSTTKQPATKVPEPSSSNAGSAIILPPEMAQFAGLDEWAASPAPEPVKKPAAQPPELPAPVLNNRWVQDGDILVTDSPVAIGDSGFPGFGAAERRVSTPAKSQSPAAPTPPPAAAPVPTRRANASSSTTLETSRMSPTDTFATTSLAPAPSTSIIDPQSVAQSAPRHTATLPTPAPLIPTLLAQAPLPTIGTTSTGFGDEGSRWLNAMSADLGITPVPAQQPKPQTGGTLGRIPKKWHWEGDLVLGDSGVPLCRLRLQEPWPSQGAEPLFKVLFNSDRAGFSLPKTYPLSQAWAFFPLFEAKQWAKIVLPETGADMIAYTGFAGHLEANQLFAMARVASQIPNSTHHIVVFHNGLKALTDGLDCPPPMLMSPHLVAAIVVPQEPQGTPGDPRRPCSWIETTRYAERRSTQLAQRISSQEVQPADLATSHRLGTKLPDTLSAQLKGRDFIIYTADLARYHDKRGMVLALGQETTDLLRSCSLAGGTFRTMYERVQFIFIHRDNWRKLHVEHANLPGLRSKRAEENASRQFWLYGTSPLCPPRYQGLELQQIFLYGGVVTFTARAVAENPKGVEALIKRIDKHPLWVCYVLPEVVALVREMTREPAYEKAKLADGVAAVSALLGPIEKRRISLMSHPPPSWDDEACRNWILDIMDTSEKKPLDVLDYCIEKLAAHRRPEANKENFVNELVFEDLRQMEGHHIVGTTYRRFVAIVEDLPETIPSYEGWERKNLRHFKFGDNLDNIQKNGVQSTSVPSAIPVTSA